MVARIPVIAGFALAVASAAAGPAAAQDLPHRDTAAAHIFGGQPFRLDALMPLRRGNARISLSRRPRLAPGLEGFGGDRPFSFREYSGGAAPSVAKGTSEREGSGLVGALADLLIPVLGVTRDQLCDSFGSPRTGHRHEGMDIMAPRGTPVVAAVDGSVLRMKWDVGGGRTLRLVDGSGKYVLYYAHLSRYAKGLKEGEPVQRGQVVAYVGRTGTVHGSSHLHLAISSLLGDSGHWWQAKPLNPYTLLRRALGLECDTAKASSACDAPRSADPAD